MWSPSKGEVLLFVIRFNFENPLQVVFSFRSAWGDDFWFLDSLN
jgi:hypothetical protein